MLQLADLAGQLSVLFMQSTQLVIDLATKSFSRLLHRFYLLAHGIYLCTFVLKINDTDLYCLKTRSSILLMLF